MGKGKGKIVKILISCFLFSSPGSPEQELAGKPGVGKGKGKIVKILISCFLFSSPGSPEQ